MLTVLSCACALMLLLLKLSCEPFTVDSAVKSMLSGVTVEPDVAVVDPLVLVWLLPMAAFMPPALVACKVVLLLAELAVAVVANWLLLAVAWVPLTATAVPASSKTNAMLPPVLMADKFCKLLLWTLSVDTAKPATALPTPDPAEGVSATFLLRPLAPTFRLSALSNTVLVAKLPCAVAVMALLLRLAEPSTVAPE